MTLPPLPSETEEISEIIITGDRPSKTTPPPSETLTFSFTSMTLPPLPSETEEISEIIITAERPSKTIIETLPPTLSFSFTSMTLPPETETESIPEIIITTDRPTKTIIETLPPTLSFSFTSMTLPPETETPTEPPTTPPPTTERPTYTFTYTPTLPPTMPPTLPPTLRPTLPPTQPPQRGVGLNPGYIDPSNFYNTYDAAQSKFNWGGHGYQVGPVFNDQQWNAAYGEDTPWGLQQLAKPLTGAQIADLIAGKNVPSFNVQSAQRRQAYDPASMATPNANNTYQLPTIPASGSVAPGSSTTPVSTMSPTTVAQQAEIVKQLGADWMSRQQKAAAIGDWGTYNQIQATVNSIINPQQEIF